MIDKMAIGSSSGSLQLLNNHLLCSGVIIIFVIIVALTYQSMLKSPPPKLCGSAGAPPITPPPLNQRDGRNLAYKEDAVLATILSPELSVCGNQITMVESKEYRLPREVKEALQAIASEWEDVIDSKALQVIPLKGAMTNEVFQIKWPTRESGPSRKVLVRIYGEGVEIFFDREDEIRTFEFMSNHGHGPLLLGRFCNGRIEEFLHARTLSASDLRDPAISSRIATRMKEFHDLDMPGVKKALLWDRLRNWLSSSKRLASPEESKSFRLESMEMEINMLEKSLFMNDENIGFCHNDLQYGNIMMDEETKAITIIDYEYSCYNPVAYDIANHFCEMAADYHTETPHIMDYSKYPDVEERQLFLKSYMSSSGDKETTDTMVTKLLEDVEKYTLASHLTWGLWGIISEHVNEIDFDYMEYARQRFEQYWLTKPKLLGTP